MLSIKSFKIIILAHTRDHHKKQNLQICKKALTYSLSLAATSA